MVLDFAYDGGPPGSGGEAPLLVDGVVVGRGRIEATTAYYFAFDETFNVGIDRGTPVSTTTPRCATGSPGRSTSRWSCGPDEGPGAADEVRATAPLARRGLLLARALIAVAASDRDGAQGGERGPRTAAVGGPQMLSTASSRPVRSRTGAETPQSRRVELAAAGGVAALPGLVELVAQRDHDR